MRQPTAIATLILFLAVPFPVFAQNKKLISSRCRSNGCWEVYFLNKKVLHQDQLDGKPRTVYEVSVELRNPRGTSQEVRWVQCSTREPYVAYSSPDWNPDTVTINSINPGERPANASVPSYMLYWAVCHNLWKVDPGSMAGKARSLGYSTQLKTNSREVPKSSFNP